MTIRASVPVRELSIDRLYDAPRMPELVRVPEVTFVMIDGRGDPNTAAEYKQAVQALYGISYALRQRLKSELGRTHRVGPLEGLWWADPMEDFSIDRKADWHWTMMIGQPDAVTPDRFEQARGDVARRKPTLPTARVRLERFDEGLAGQVLHLGPYSAEGPTIERLHGFVRELGSSLRDKHHEIYLGDPRRAAPERLRTIIRQPVSG